MPGPPPKPEIVRRQEGNPSKRPIRRAPAADPTIPDMPAWLDGTGRRAWKLFTAELAAMGQLAKVDGPALEAVCSAYQTAIQCRRRIKRKGITMKVGNGYEQVRPEVALERQAWAQFRAFCVEFGLTPAARVRLGVDAPDDVDDELEKTLAG